MRCSRLTLYGPHFFGTISFIFRVSIFNGTDCWKLSKRSRRANLACFRIKSIANPFRSEWPSALTKGYMNNNEILCQILIYSLFSLKFEKIFLFRFHLSTTFAYTIAVLFFIALLPLTWMHFVWNRCKDPHDEYEGHVPQPRNKLLHFMYQTSIKVTNQKVILLVNVKFVVFQKNIYIKKKNFATH